MPKLHTVEIQVKLIGTEGTAVTRKGGIGLTLLASKLIGADAEIGLPKEVAYRAGQLTGEAIRDWKFEHKDFTVLPETRP